MIYFTLFLSMTLFIWALVIVCKVNKRLSLMRKKPNETTVLLTRNEELRLVWLLISYLLIVGNGLCYGMIFDQSDFVKLNLDVLKGIGRIFLYVMLVPPNSLFIITTIIVIRKNQKILSNIEGSAATNTINQPLAMGAFSLYFMVVFICTVCCKMDFINYGMFFSILTYGKVIVLGFMVIALRTQPALSESDGNAE